MTPRAPCPAAALGAALALVLAALACAEGPTEPACEPAPPRGVLSLWTACPVQSLSQDSIELTLTNDTTETVWFYHECGPEVPWPTQLQPDGTWVRLLPDGFYLGIECDHVHELRPGESGPVWMSTQRVDRPGTYRAEMLAAYDCVDAHEPLHLGHACQRMEYLLSEPFELR